MEGSGQSHGFLNPLCSTPRLVRPVASRPKMGYSSCDIMMNRRYLSASILLLTLLTSGVASLMAAAFCPGVSRLGADCHDIVLQARGSHSDMTHEMHGMDMSHSATEGEQTIIVSSQPADLLLTTVSMNRAGQPLSNCSHCITHSNLPRNKVGLRQANIVRPCDGIDEPEPLTNISHAVLTPRAVTAGEHAPPTASSPLHVRINVFRI